MNKIKSLVFRIGVMLSVMLGLASTSHAAIDTALSGLVTDMTTYWGTVSALVLTVVIFGIGISFAKRLKSR